MKVLIKLLVLAAVFVVSPAALSDPDDVVKSALDAAASILGVKEEVTVPKVVLVGKKEFKKVCKGAPRNTGCYSTTTSTLYMSKNINLNDKSSMSILVHEAVHHIQNVVAKPVYAWDCPALSEVDAELVQKIYVSKVSPNGREVAKLHKKHSCDTGYVNRNIEKLAAYDPSFFVKHTEEKRYFW